jgi:DNA-directed RNA polymerase beta' subunit
MLVDGYKESIRYLAENQKNEIVYNSDSEHALVVLSELIKNASNYVHIVCKNMDPVVADKPEYLSAVKFFLEKNNTEMKILLTDYEESLKERKIFKLFKEHSDKVFIKYFEKKVQIASGGSPINWTVSDDKSIRVEKDIDNYIAFANFNDPELAKKYDGHFNAFFADNRSAFIGLN